MMQPVAPTGCPRAMPLPLGLVFSIGSPTLRITANACAPNASLNSITPMSSSFSPANAIAFGMATTGPMPMISGGTPPVAKLRKRAFGFKPTWGSVPQYPASVVQTLSHAGPITRSVGDAVLMLAAMAGPDARDRASMPPEALSLDDIEGGIKGLRVAWSSDLGYAAVDPAVADKVAAAARRFEELGCTVEQAHPDAADPWRLVHTMWSTAFAAYFRDSIDQVREQLTPGLAAIVDEGMAFQGTDVAAAYIERNAYYEVWRAFLDSYDLLLTPTLPCTAFAAGDDHPGTIDGRETTYLGWTAFTYPVNLTGQPAASVPCGFVDGLPVGLQIIGGFRQDRTVLRAARAFEEMAPKADREVHAAQTGAWRCRSRRSRTVPVLPPSPRSGSTGTSAARAAMS